MKIAIFDYKINESNPIGGCHLKMMAGLCREHDFTVFAVEFENPCPLLIRFVRIPVPTRPLALLFLSYHVLAPLVYLLDVLRGNRYDVVQLVESNLSFGHISYAHFCHRAFLSNHWKHIGARGLRAFIRWMDHWLHSLVEPWIYGRVHKVVVPSLGFKEELECQYPFLQAKIHVIPNPVDLGRMVRPPGFDRNEFRKKLGFDSWDLVLVFVALGHFERKGLPLLLDAFKMVSVLKLLIVGGTSDLVRYWEHRAAAMGLGERIKFVGMQSDVRPFLWMSDVFVFPSAYETFSLVSFESAAAGLPLLVTPLYGVEEFMLDGETGWVMERSVDAISQKLQALMRLSAEKLISMGHSARQAVERFSTESFVEAWRVFYASMTDDTSLSTSEAK